VNVLYSDVCITNVNVSVNSQSQELLHYTCVGVEATLGWSFRGDVIVIVPYLLVL